MADTKPADTGAAAAKALLAKQRDDRDKAIKGTTDPSPVPTQEEIDMARLGYPPEGAVGEAAAGHSTKAMGASSSTRHGYETRGAGAAHKGD